MKWRDVRSILTQVAIHPNEREQSAALSWGRGGVVISDTMPNQDEYVPFLGAYLE